MKPIKFAAICGAILTLSALGAETAAAQSIQDRAMQERTRSQRDRDQADEGERESRRGRAPREQSPEQTKAAIERALSTAGITCQVTQAKHLGQNEERQMIYETACASAPGYIILASEPPQTFNCLELAATAIKAKEADPAAPAGQLCALPANQNGKELAQSWVQQAGVTCTVDDAMAIGRADDDSLVYEVGCAGTDGFWLEQTNGAWAATPCLQITSSGRTCRFTATTDQAALFTAKLASTDASDCTVTQVRIMGENDNGTFAEVKCSTEGEGYIVRMDKAGVAQQVYGCRTAQRIGGGCTLTPAPPLPAAAPGSED